MVLSFNQAKNWSTKIYPTEAINLNSNNEGWIVLVFKQSWVNIYANL